MTSPEDKLATERQLWACEKAMSRLATPDDMRWILRQAGDDYAVAEKYLDVWDACVSACIYPFYLIAEMGRQRRITRQILTTTPITFDPAHKISFAISPLPQVRNDVRRFIDLPRHMLGDTFSVSPPYVVPMRISALPVRLAVYLALEWVL